MPELTMTMKADELATALKAAKPVADTLKLEIVGGKLRMQFIDVAHIFMARYDMDIESHEGVFDDLVLDTEALLNAVKIFPKTETLTIEADGGNVTVKAGRKRRVVPLLDARAAPPSKDLTYAPEEWYPLKSAEFIEVVKDTKSDFDGLYAIRSAEGWSVSAWEKGTRGGYQFELSSTGGGDVKSLFSTDYLAYIMAFLPKDADIEFHTATNKPLAVRGEKFVVLLAPRIESE